MTEIAVTFGVLPHQKSQKYHLSGTERFGFCRFAEQEPHPSILSVGHLKRPYAAFARKVPCHACYMLRRSVLAAADTSIDRKLQHHEAVVLQEVAKSCSITALNLSADRQVEENE